MAIQDGPRPGGSAAKQTKDLGHPQTSKAIYLMVMKHVR